MSRRGYRRLYPMSKRTLHLSFTAKLTLVGLTLLAPYGCALALGDLRQQTPCFEVTFFAAFGLYAVAVGLALKQEKAERGALPLIVLFAVLYSCLLVFTRPTLSDDMYRYVWDGRVQAHGHNPYLYPPNASELVSLRDEAVWPLINRKGYVTVYPAGAELAFAALWRIVPDSVRWFQVAMAGGALLGGLLLIPLLRIMGRPSHLALIYLWSPLLLFETAHAGHVDGLVLPLLVGAWLARAKGRNALTGALLGAATALKLYPIVLLPVLWRPRDEKGHLSLVSAGSMPLAFVAVLAAAYVPYMTEGTRVVGFLPQYLTERFNMGLAGTITSLVERLGGEPASVVNGLLLAALVVVSLVAVVRPAGTATEAIRRCIWPITAFTLLTQNLFPWYMLWSVPWLALFAPPDKESLAWRRYAWAAWFLFSGSVVLAYTFFVEWKPVRWALYVQFIPLYLLLLAGAWSGRRAERRR